MNDYCFRAIRNGSLRAAGFGSEDVDVVLVDDALIMASPNGPRRVIPLARISRVRFGYERVRFSSDRYRMKIWSADAPQPLLLMTIHADEPAFASISRRLAAALWASRGPGAVEGGLGWVAALAFLLLMTGGTTIIALVASLQDAHGVHVKEPPLSDILLLVVIAVWLIGTLLWFFYRPYRPRRLSTPAQLDRVLPGRDRPDR